MWAASFLTGRDHKRVVLRGVIHTDLMPLWPFVRVTCAVTKLEGGLRPDVKGVGEGVLEARIDDGLGYRVYFGLNGMTLVILLGGGDKKTQQHDIGSAHAAWASYKARKKEGAKDHGDDS